MNEGKISTLLGLPGIPHSSEDTIVARDLLLAEEFGGRIHICHISSGRSVELVRQFKARGVKVSCETCPHYFSITDDLLQGYNSYAKMNPPLRELPDQKEIIRGLQDGTIDAIATDHAPHHDDFKKLELPSAAFGIIGLESSWALTYTQLVKTKQLTLDQAVALLTQRPAGVLSLDRGTLKTGTQANVTLVDPTKKWTFGPEQVLSKSKNSPFYGWNLQSKVVRTIYSGKTVYSE
jgi:dihydroorotase